MKHIKHLFIFLILILGATASKAQLIEGNPCTATCIDPSGKITGRQPNQNNVSPNQNLPCGSGTSEDNPAWWIVRPAGNTLTFTVTTTNCVAGGCGLGVQMTLWEGDACGSVTAIDCVVGTSGTFTSSVTPCKVYYLQVDGLCECQCNVTLTYDKNQILKTVPKPVLTGPKTACVGATVKICASIPGLPGCRPDGYTWRIDPAGSATVTPIPGEPDCANVKINSVPPGGKIKICAKPKFNGKCPPTVQEECLEIEVINLKPATCDVKICPEERPYEYELKKCIKTTNPTFNANISPETYIINFPPGTKKQQKITYTVEGSGCKGDVTLNIEVLDNKPVQIPPVILCEKDTVIVKQQQFTCADASPAIKKFQKLGSPKPLRCDSTFEVLVQCIKITPKITGAATLDCSTKEVTLNAGGTGTLTLPNSITLTTYKGTGKREYQWYKDGVLMVGETNPTLKVTNPGKYLVELKYTYEIEMTINGKAGKWSNTCSKTAEVEIKGQSGSSVAEDPIPSGTPCANGTAVYSINPDPLAQQYTWSVSGATVVNQSTNPSGVVAVTVTNSGTPYTVCLTKKACDIVSAPNCITVTPTPGPVQPIPIGPSPVCQGDTAAYNIGNLSTYGPDVTFNWVVTNGTIVGASNEPTVNVAWSNTATSGSITLTVTDPCGTNDSTITIVINDLPAKPSQINGKLIVCVGDKESYTVGTAAFATSYGWSLGSGGILSAPAPGLSVEVTWNSVGTHQLCVKSFNNCLPQGTEEYCIDIEVRPVPQPLAGTDRKVCALTTTLEGTFSGLTSSGTWSLVSGPGTAIFGSGTSATTSVSVTDCGDYLFEFKESNGICEGRDTVKIKFSEPPKLLKQVSTCNAAAKTYNLVLQLSGCDGPFSAPTSKYPVVVDPVTGYLLINNIPQSDPAWSIIVSNSSGCNVTLPIEVDCDCETLAGTMKLEATQVACELNGKVKGIHNGDENNDGNDTYVFVLHEGSGGSIFNEVARNKTGEFGFDKNTMVCGKTYYISYVIANNKNNEPDETDKCLQVTPQGQPVRWDCMPTPNAGPDISVCGLSATLSASTPITGASGVWTGGGTFDDATKLNANVSVTSAGLKTFTWTETNGTCTAKDDVTVNFIKSDLIKQDVIYTCNSTNDFYDYTFTVTGGSAPYYILSSTGTVLSTLSTAPYTYTVTNIPSGDPITLKVTDAYNCDTITITDSHLCGCTTNLGTLTIGDPEVCADKELVASVTGGNKDGNDVEEFILSEDCDPNNTTAIKARNNTGKFTLLPDMTCDVTYKLIYIIGNETSPGSGQVSITDKCKKSVCRDVKFICIPNPSATVVDVDSCDLEVTLQASPGTNGQWSVTGGTGTFTPSSSTANVVAKMSDYGTYTFTWTETNGECSNTAQVVVTINKKGNLSYSVDTLCATNGKTYQLQFTVSGQNPTLHSSSTATGTWSGNVFTTDPVTSGTKIKVCFIDDLVCSPLCAEFEPKCPCLTNAGQMSQNKLEACVDGKITVTIPAASTGLFLDSDDTGEFYLHKTNGADKKLTDPITHNTTGEFTFDPIKMVAGTTYYVSYVVGDKSSSNPNEVDLQDGCLDVSLGQPIVFNALPTLKAAQNSVICKGSNANIVLTMSGKSPYSVVYSANAIAQSPIQASQSSFTQVVNPLETTNYAFTRITDGNGCVSTVNENIEVKVNQPVSSGIASPDRRQCLGVDSEIDMNLELNGADAGGTWVMSPLAAEFNPTTGIFKTKNTPVGVYSFSYTVKGEAPCPNATTTLKVTIDPIPVANAGADQDLNCDASEVIIGGQSAQGPSIEYTWITVSGEPLTNTKSRTTTVRKAGVFMLEVRDNISQCYSRDTVVVTNNVNEITSFTNKMTEPSCFGEDNGSIDILSVVGGTPNFSYSINNGPFTQYKNFVNLKAGIYSITIKDKRSCTFTDTVTVTEPEEIDVAVGDDIDLELGEEYTIQAQINFDLSDLKSTVWTPTCDSCLSPPKNKSLSYKIKPNETTLYTITVTDKKGCRTSDNILLRVNKPRRVYIPNVFYPGSEDDRNRKLKVFLGVDVLKVHYFRVYDRWGNAVYEDLEFTRRDVATQDKGWDGQFRGQLAQPGVYTYGCLVEFIDGYKEVFKGDVLLIDK